VKGFRRRQIAVTPADALAGLTGFADVEAVAAGASSEVFRARQPDFDRVVAVKVFSVTLSDKRTRERFAQELAVTGRLDGLDNIVVVHDRGITPSNHPFLVMRWYDGGSLADAIAAEGPLEIERVLRLGVRLTAALAEAHGRSVVHRDLKPANVLLTARDEPVLADFGVSTLTSATTAATRALTPVHAAPEMFNDAAVDERSDIWSMGSTLYTALAARPPFAASAAVGEGAGTEGLLPMLLRLANEPLPPLVRQDVPPSLWAVLERSMAKQPADRFASATEMTVALQDVQRELGLPVTEAAGPPTSPPRRASAPTIAPAAPPTPAPAVDEGTMLGSGAQELARRAAAATSERRGLTRGKIAAIGGAGVALVVIVVVVIGFATGGAKQPVPGGGSSPTGTPSANGLPAGVSPPTGVHVVTSTATSIALAWTDSNAGRLTYVVLGGPATQVAQSKTAATVTKLSPKTAYCLRVAAVYSVSGGLAPSAPVCVTTP
jgi:tRNA A-37 threonylcarbamoyl transferase component Bud32